MINLIPPHGKTYVTRQYLMRVVAVWMLLFATSFLIIAAMLAPTYVLLTQRLAAVSLAYDRAVQEDVAAYEEARTAIRYANTLAAKLVEPRQSALPSDVWNAVTAAQSQDISLSNFVYTHNGASSFDIQVVGTAATRESLIAFRDALERSPLFTSATVPVSHLARDANLPFTMTVVVQGSTATP